MIEIHHATEADILTFYGKPSDSEILTAYSVMRNGEIEAIAGIVFENGQSVFFSDIKVGVIAPKMTIWRVSREVVKRVLALNIPVMAIENCNIPNAKRYLESLGFVLSGEVNGEKLYRLTNGI